MAAIESNRSFGGSAALDTSELSKLIDLGRDVAAIAAYGAARLALVGSSDRPPEFPPLSTPALALIAEAVNTHSAQDARSQIERLGFSVLASASAHSVGRVAGEIVCTAALRTLPAARERCQHVLGAVAAGATAGWAEYAVESSHEEKINLRKIGAIALTTAAFGALYGRDMHTSRAASAALSLLKYQAWSGVAATALAWTAEAASSGAPQLAPASVGLKPLRESKAP